MCMVTKRVVLVVSMLILHWAAVRRPPAGYHQQYRLLSSCIMIAKMSVCPSGWRSEIYTASCHRRLVNGWPYCPVSSSVMDIGDMVLAHTTTWWLLVRAVLVFKGEGVAEFEPFYTKWLSLRVQIGIAKRGRGDCIPWNCDCNSIPSLPTQNWDIILHTNPSREMTNI